MRFFIAQTRAIAAKRAPGGYEPIGMRGQVYSTPDAVIFDDTLMIDEKGWEWLLGSNVLAAREVSCGNTSLWTRSV